MRARTRSLLITLAVLMLSAPVAAQSGNNSPSFLISTTCPGDGCAVLATNDKATASVTLTVTGTAVASFEVSNNGFRNFSTVSATPPNSTTAVTTASSSGTWTAPVAGWTQFRVRLTTCTSCSVETTMALSTAPSASTASVSGSFSGNAAASATGAAVPASADYVGLNIGGNIVGQTGLSVGSARAAAMALVDGSGNQITSVGGGTQYAEGATAATITGTAVMFESNTGTNTLSVVNSTTPLPTTTVVTSVPTTTVTANNLDVQIGGSDTVQVQSNSANLATQTTAAAILAKQPALGVAGTPATDVISVQGVASGTAMPISAASLPLPSTAATSTKQSDGSQKTQIVDGAGNVIGATSNALDVNIKSGAGSGGTAATDNSAFTAGTTNATPMSGFYHSTVDTVTDGRVAAVGLTSKRALFSSLFTPLGVSAMNEGAGAVKVLNVDASGTTLTSDTQATHDGPLGTITSVTGSVPMGRASAAAPTDVSADGDAVIPWLLRNGSSVANIAAGGTLVTATSTSLNVNCTGGCSGGTQYTQDAPLTVATTVGTMAMGRASAAVPTDVSADGDAVIPWYLRSGALSIQPTFAGVLGVAGNGASGTGVQRVTLANDSTGVLATVSNVTTVGTLTGGGVAHDGAAAGVSPLLTGCYASAAAPTDVSADNDATRIWCLRNGAQSIQPTFAGVLGVAGNGASGTGVQRVTLANDSTGVLATVSNVTTVGTLTGGGVAHDGADSGNPVKVGAHASTSVAGRTMVQTDDRTDIVAGVDGVQIVRPHANLEDIVQDRATNTDGASTAFAGGLAAPGAGVRIWLLDCSITNSSASAITVDIRDGSAGSVLWTFSVPAGGGSNHGWAVPLRFTANTAVAYDGSAAATTLTVSCNGFKSKL